MTQSEHTCRWVRLPAMQGRPAQYCGQPVSYRYERQPDGTMRRVYDTFCLMHQTMADDAPQDEEDDS